MNRWYSIIIENAAVPLCISLFYFYMRRMHAKGKSTDEIAEMLGLTVEKIRSIIGEDGV